MSQLPNDEQRKPYRVMNADYKYLYVGYDDQLALSIFREMALAAGFYGNAGSAEPSVIALDNDGHVIGTLYGLDMAAWVKFSGGN